MTAMQQLQQNDEQAQTVVRGFVEQNAGRLILADLPGRAACAAVCRPEGLYVVVDDSKLGAWTLAEDMLPDVTRRLAVEPVKVPGVPVTGPTLTTCDVCNGAMRKGSECGLCKRDALPEGPAL